MTISYVIPVPPPSPEERKAYVAARAVAKLRRAALQKAAEIDLLKSEYEGIIAELAARQAELDA